MKYIHYINASEKARLNQIKARRAKLDLERRRILNRARMRMERDNTQ
jgi:hypothetical protein